MRRDNSEQAAWANDEFGHAQLGDSRRTLRVLNMATRAAQRPGGKITDVFTKDKERQGAYDLLESMHVDARSLSLAAGQAAARRASLEAYAFVAIDGSSIAPTDEKGGKRFGSIGSLTKGGRGLKVISALGISPDGVPLGMFAQVWWVRRNAQKRTKQEKKNHARRRTADEKETRRWLEAIDDAASRARETNAALWFVIDREADGRDVLLKLAETKHRFTVRSSSNRRLETDDDDPQYLRDSLEYEAPKGEYFLKVAAGPSRSARLARMIVSWQSVTLRLREGSSRAYRLLQVNIVRTHEEGTCPDGEKPLDWHLITNSTVSTLDDAQQVIDGYALRWRVEEFHKTWKSGACKVEETQLRTVSAVTSWATILASVAIRIERLKLLSRTKPEQPASVEFSEPEIRALILLKRDEKKRNEAISDLMPSIEEATRWIAELGGYTGKSSGGPPGSITIRRGLERLGIAARVYAALAVPDT